MPAPDAIRHRLQGLLATIRGADRMPWNVQDLRVNRLVFHQMANSLPDDERDALRHAFVRELDRLQADHPRAVVDLTPE